MRLFAALSVLLILAGCGFQPVHSRSSISGVSTQEALSQVQIGNIPDREGQYLRNALIDRFYRDGRPDKPVFTLSVDKISESLVDLDITKSADTTRGQLKLRTDIKLTDNTIGKVVLERRLSAITSYNILASEFANRITEENARQNALDDLARQIELQVTLFLKR